jgi:GAF domain-containing protein
VVDGPSQEAAHWQRLLDGVVHEREPVAMPTPALAPAPSDQVEGWGAHGLLVPIWGEDAVLALLALGGRATERPFSDEDRALAQVAARHAGQACKSHL